MWEMRWVSRRWRAGKEGVVNENDGEGVGAMVVVDGGIGWKGN